MTDAELAEAASVYFGGRRQAEHMLTCDQCVDEPGRSYRCPRYPRPGG